MKKVAEKPAGRGSVVTVGTFDGVHLGHQTVLAELSRISAATGLEPVAVTFDRHPLEVVCPERTPGLIMDRAMRNALLQEAGMRVAEVEFSEKLRRLTCAEWMECLVRDYDMRTLVLGYDNTFGSDGIDLSSEDYRQIGAALGVQVVIAPHRDRCSSSAVRRALRDGDTTLAAALLGRPFSITGTVTRGRQLGRTIGVPTANITLPAGRLLPADGVYFATAVADGKSYPAVVNIGTNPTVDENGRVHVEAHLLDFSGDLYGKTLELRFGERIRGEKRFAGLDQLRLAIREDIACARRLAQLSVI